MLYEKEIVYLVKGERIVLEGGIRKDDIDYENDTDENHRFKFTVTKRTAFVEFGGHFLHYTCIHKAGEHVNLIISSNGESVQR